MLASQLENTLVLSSRDLLIEGRNRPTPAQLANLASLVQATVLFDDVWLPGRKGREVSPLTMLPESLSNSGAFKYHSVQDATERREAAKICMLNTSLPINSNDSGNTLITYLKELLNKQKYASAQYLWADIEDVIKGRTEYEKEGVPKALDEFSSNEYSNLDQMEKLALYYWLKSIYNTKLAIDEGRMFFCNYARTPLKLSAYESIEKKYMREPILKALVKSGDAYAAEVSRTIGESRGWVFALSNLLSEVLNRAHHERKNVASAIIDLRNSTKAERFRRHYRELVEKNQEYVVFDEITKDIEHMADLWNSISEKGRERITILQPFYKSYLGTGKILDLLDKERTFAKYFRHLSIFWEAGAFEISLNSAVHKDIVKTYGIPLNV